VTSQTSSLYSSSVSCRLNLLEKRGVHGALAVEETPPQQFDAFQMTGVLHQLMPFSPATMIIALLAVLVLAWLIGVKRAKGLRADVVIPGVRLRSADVL
jgi:hypothetical protein